MKIMNVIGSPRASGNSATVAQMLLEKLPIAKAQVRTVQLNKLDYRGCQGCMACKIKFDQCAVKDDLTADVGAPQEHGPGAAMALRARDHNTVVVSYHSGDEIEHLGPGEIRPQSSGPHVDNIHPRGRFSFYAVE